MQRWQLSMGLAGTAVVAALLAPRLFPLLSPQAAPVSTTPTVVEPPPTLEPIAVAEPNEPRTIDLVVAIDTSDVAITALNSAAMSAGVRDRIDSRVVDLDEGVPTELMDAFTLVICQRFRVPA